jgi:hypothetical protein
MVIKNGMKQLIKPRLIGRLGNNLFQIAASIGYAKTHNVGWGIKKGYKDRSFNVKQVDQFLPHLPPCDSYFKPYTEFQHEWAGSEFNYHEIHFHPNGVEIVGFWQSEKYFKHAEHEVRKAINITYHNEYKGYCSIHVRRGDYVNLSTNFPPITDNYLDIALDELYNRVGKVKLIWFSDDIEWCKLAAKRVAPDYEHEFSEGRNEWDDLCLMASCSYNIIANSSFSWWAGWLNRNPDKIVITPSHKAGQWFGPQNGVKHDCIDLIPEGWIEIEFRKWRMVRGKYIDENDKTTC